MLEGKKELKTFYQFLIFLERDNGQKKTRKWECKNKKSGTTLGIVEWYKPWRQYCYFPIVQAVYSEGCLRDIADFIGQLKSL